MSQVALLRSQLPPIMEGVLSVATAYNTEVLTLCLEVLCSLVGVEPAFTVQWESKLCPLTIAVFLKHSSGESGVCSPPLLFASVQLLFLFRIGHARETQ